MSEVKPLSLSSAIRLGAMLKPQGFGCGSASPLEPESCALGAAYDAAGLTSPARMFVDLAAVFPLLTTAFDGKKALPCPACGLRNHYGLIPHLNDYHEWTRERIADFVESIEQQQAQPEIPQPASVEAS